MRYADGMIEVRDTKDHGSGPVLRFTLDELAAWLDGAKRGEFDHLLWAEQLRSGCSRRSADEFQYCWLRDAHRTLPSS
jgi:hypothetical protein